MRQQRDVREANGLIGACGPLARGLSIVAIEKADTMGGMAMARPRAVVTLRTYACRQWFNVFFPSV